ncbi:MAG TPA: hypothetical protein VFZ40_08790 [Pyrinomonadaceae bacterium]
MAVLPIGFLRSNVAADYSRERLKAQRVLVDGIADFVTSVSL